MSKGMARVFYSDDLWLNKYSSLVNIEMAVRVKKAKAYKKNVSEYNAFCDMYFSNDLGVTSHVVSSHDHEFFAIEDGEIVKPDYRVYDVEGSDSHYMVIEFAGENKDEAPQQEQQDHGHNFYTCDRELCLDCLLEISASTLGVIKGDSHE